GDRHAGPQRVGATGDTGSRLGPHRLVPERRVRAVHPAGPPPAGRRHVGRLVPRLARPPGVRRAAARGNDGRGTPRRTATVRERVAASPAPSRSRFANTLVTSAPRCDVLSAAPRPEVGTAGRVRR